MREVFRVLRDAIIFLFWLIFPCGGRENQKGIPDSAESGQPARLDRAGSQTRTRLSPAGGNGCGVGRDSAQFIAQALDLQFEIFETSVILQHKIAFFAIKCLIRLRVDACGGGGFT